MKQKERKRRKRRKGVERKREGEKEGEREEGKQKREREKLSILNIINIYLVVMRLIMMSMRDQGLEMIHFQEELELILMFEQTLSQILFYR